MAEITDAELAELRALPALLARLERAEKDAEEARQVSERDRCPSNESLRGTMDILEDARVNGGDMPISAGKAIELCETVIALRDRIATLEAALREARISGVRAGLEAAEDWLRGRGHHDLAASLSGETMMGGALSAESIAKEAEK